MDFLQIGCLHASRLTVYNVTIFMKLLFLKTKKKKKEKNETRTEKTHDKKNKN